MTTPDNPPIPSSTPPENAGHWYLEHVEPHASALRSWLRSRFPWLRDVEDVAQEAGFRLWRRKTKPDSAPLISSKAALYAIARNLAIDERRRNDIVSMESVADMAKLSVYDNADVAETVCTRQELEFLADALRTLPNRCRQVMTLTKIYGLTEKEVAQKLGISENTVRTHIVRGMERCTEYLRKHNINRGLA